jgi:hypothetical protein
MLEGEHPEFGVVTLRQLLATWVAHDLGHVARVSAHHGPLTRRVAEVL